MSCWEIRAQIQYGWSVWYQHGLCQNGFKSFLYPPARPGVIYFCIANLTAFIFEVRPMQRGHRISDAFSIFCSKHSYLTFEGLNHTNTILQYQPHQVGPPPLAPPTRRPFLNFKWRCHYPLGSLSKSPPSEPDIYGQFVGRQILRSRYVRHGIMTHELHHRFSGWSV